MRVLAGDGENGLGEGIGRVWSIVGWFLQSSKKGVTEWEDEWIGVRIVCILVASDVDVRIRYRTTCFTLHSDLSSKHFCPSCVLLRLPSIEGLDTIR